MLAVIGAALKLRSGTGVDTAIHEHIRDGLRLALGDAAADLDDAEIAPLLVEIEMAFVESGELFREPDRTAQWKIEDRNHLQAMGRSSSNAFDRILGLASTRPSLQAALDGVFLDVGTGVGGVALRAAQTCPDLDIDAIDIWEPALRLAAENVAASAHGGRIRLRRLDVTALDPGPRYTLAWLPTMFMTLPVLEQAIDRIAAASCSGSWLVAPLYTRPDDPFMAVMSSLRTLRSGGEVTQAVELEALLRARGYVDIEVDVGPIATFVMGRLA
ncbi:methyltransferase domain-containing protein [Massilia sp. CFBP9012]|nr:methyltransferase domain-containing protein [Massilia sp. CFBP9012]